MIPARKRLTIGVELASRPSALLFLDEPTSGLDAQSAFNVVRILRKLAAAGQVCTPFSRPKVQLTFACSPLFVPSINRQLSCSRTLIVSCSSNLGGRRSILATLDLIPVFYETIWHEITPLVPRMPTLPNSCWKLSALAVRSESDPVIGRIFGMIPQNSSKWLQN